MEGRIKGHIERLGPFSFMTRTLILALYLIGAILGVGGMLAVRGFTGRLSDDWIRAIILISVPWVLGAHVLALLRREAPRLGMPSITGRLALVQGLFGSIVFGALELYMLTTLVKDLLLR